MDFARDCEDTEQLRYRIFVTVQIDYGYRNFLNMVLGEN